MIAISNSEMRAHDWCKRHWYLAYYRELTLAPELERPVGDAKLGTRVHTVLELYYGHHLDPRATLKVIYDEARQYWTDDEDTARLNKEQDLALAMVDGYLEWVAETGVDEDLTVVATEDDLIIPSAVDGVNFRAKLDQRVTRESDGARLFLDHKTVGSFEHATTILHLDPQMRFYTMLEAINARAQGDAAPRVDGGLFNMLRRVKRTTRAKPPFYQRVEVRYNRAELIATWVKANAVVTNITETRRQLDRQPTAHHGYAYPNPNRDCVWRCQFVAVCPLMDDGSRWEDLLAARYVERDPYSHYTPVDVERVRAHLREGLNDD